MTRERLERIEEVVQAVLEAPEEERASRLHALCGDDDALLREATSLLEHAPASEDFLEQPWVSGVADEMFDEDLTGERIGAYRLERRIGVGGMGAVYLGTRSDGTGDRTVAIKLIRPGLASASMLRRFRAERATLARLEHPNIARLLDGGTDAQGRAYLVMEYVEGRPLPVYCDEQGLGVRDRLEVFLRVCDALSYAHRNLIVHRDLKPANILVTEEGRPKLVDFGIASVLESEGGVAATRTGVRPLTPEYASPEQVRGEAITTASDVYSLGVVLYELLAGGRPYEIGGAAWGAAERIVCETDAPAPSTTASRALDDETRSEQLRGDLDTVVMKAMRKSPAERYASVDDLAADIRRHLARRPVLARPPSRTYRLQRFVSRHRAGVVAGALGVLLAAGFVAAIIGQSMALAEERDRAVAALERARVVSRFWEELLEAVQPGEAGHDVLVRELLDEASTRTETELEGAPRERASLDGVIGRAQMALGDLEGAEPHLRRAMEQWQSIEGKRSAETIEAVNDLAQLLYLRARPGEAAALLRGYEAAARALEPDPDGLAALTLNNLGALARVEGDLERAEALYDEALALRRASGDAIGEAETLNNIAYLRAQQGDIATTIELLEESLAIREEALSETHPLTIQSIYNLGTVYSRIGEAERAEAYFERALRAARESLPEGHYDLARPLTALGEVRVRAGRAGEAVELVREALEILRATVGPASVGTVETGLLLSEALAQTGRMEEAIGVADEVAADVPERLRDNEPFRRLAAWRDELAGRLEAEEASPDG